MNKVNIREYIGIYLMFIVFGVGLFSAGAYYLCYYLFSEKIANIVMASLCILYGFTISSLLIWDLRNI